MVLQEALVVAQEHLMAVRLKQAVLELLVKDLLAVRELQTVLSHQLQEEAVEAVLVRLALHPQLEILVMVVLV
jgi:hypothetical protein